MDTAPTNPLAQLQNAAGQMHQQFARTLSQAFAATRYVINCHHCLATIHEKFSAKLAHGDLHWLLGILRNDTLVILTCGLCKELHQWHV